MTVNVLYTVWCDGKRDGENDCGNWIAADTAWEARDEACAAGWACGKKLNSRDLCPEHVAADVVTASRTDRQPPNPVAGAKGGTVPDGPAHNLLSSWCLLALDDPDIPGTTAEENCELCRPRT